MCHFTGLLEHSRRQETSQEQHVHANDPFLVLFSSVFHIIISVLFPSILSSEKRVHAQSAVRSEGLNCSEWDFQLQTRFLNTSEWDF